MRTLALTFTLTLLFLNSFSQPWLFTSDSTSNKKNYRIIGLPAVFYTPETSWGFGGTAVCSFIPKKDTAGFRTSSINLTALYTLKKQAVFSFSYQLYPQSGDYNFYGDIGYYKYNFNYWGIGAETADSAKERYFVKYPRLRFNLLRQTVKHLYAGIKYGLDDVRFTETDPTGELVQGITTGSKGGTVSSAGIVLKYDSRDNTFFPGKGVVTEFYAQTDDSWTGSDFRFAKYSFDACSYFTIRPKHIFALNLYSALETGDPPFNQLLFMGGSRRLRGYYEGRFRDKSMVLLQGEYRFPIFWLISGAVFGGYGGIAPDYASMGSENFKYNYGAGLRFMLDPQRGINARFDYGRVKGEGNFYVTLGEAF